MVYFFVMTIVMVVCVGVGYGASDPYIALPITMALAIIINTWFAVGWINDKLKEYHGIDKKEELDETA